MYFTQETEDAINWYNAVCDCDEKNEIYFNYIKKPFDKIAENIINTYKFMYIPESFVDIQSTVVSHMFMNIYRFDANNGGKAFSYFSVMCKNYLIAWNDARYAELAKLVSTNSITSDDEYSEFDVADNSYIDDSLHSDIFDFVNLAKLVSTNSITSDDEYNEFDVADNSYIDDSLHSDIFDFVNQMTDYWDDNIECIFKKKRDIDIAYAVNELFKRPTSIEVFNKKALYLIIREMTGYKTQYISKVINKMLTYYVKINKQYYNSGHITGTLV